MPGRRYSSRKKSRKNYRSASTGRYVKAATVKRNPGGTVGEARRRNSGSRRSTTKGNKRNYRSASTGRYVKKATADRHPGRTVSEARK